MDENPYQPPQEYTPATQKENYSREELKRFAICQKVMFVCFLIHLGAIILQIELFEKPNPLIALALVPVGVVGSIFVFIFSKRVYYTLLAVGLGFLTIIPGCGFFMLLVVNIKAISIFRKRGIPACLFGVKLSDISG